MELHINLRQKREKSKNKLLFGIVWIILGLTYFFSKIYYDGLALTFFNWIFTISFVILGIVFIFQGTGNPIEIFFGKAFISVDVLQICIKKSPLDKERVYLWNDIKSIRFDRNQFYINDNGICIVPEGLKSTDFLSLQNFISKIAAEKGISDVIMGE